LNQKRRGNTADVLHRELGITHRVSDEEVQRFVVVVPQSVHER
jgi:hypothetical protein